MFLCFVARTFLVGAGSEISKENPQKKMSVLCQLTTFGETNKNGDNKRYVVMGGVELTKTKKCQFAHKKKEGCNEFFKKKSGVICTDKHKEDDVKYRASW